MARDLFQGQRELKEGQTNRGPEQQWHSGQIRKQICFVVMRILSFGLLVCHRAGIAKKEGLGCVEKC